jgi:maleate isomerase
MITSGSIDRPHGWRARFGLLQPAPTPENIPYEFYLMAPDGVSLVVTSFDVRIPDDRTSVAALKEAYEGGLSRLDAAAAALGKCNVDVIIQVGLPPVLTQGWGFERQLVERVARVTSAPLVVGASACVAALGALGLSRIAVLNPWDTYSAGLKEYAGHAGIEVLGMGPVPTPAGEVERQAPRVALEAGEALFKATPGAQGLWITGAFMPSVTIIDELERRIGAPVVTNLQALVWAGLRAAEIDAPVPGFGRLFDVR